MHPLQPPVAPNGDIIQHQPPVNDRREFLLENVRGDGNAPPLDPERATLLPPPKNKEERMRWLLEKFPGLTSEQKALQKHIGKEQPECPSANTERLKLLCKIMKTDPSDLESKKNYCQILTDVQLARKNLGTYDEENFPVEELISTLKDALRLNPEDVESCRLLSLHLRDRSEFASSRKYINKAFKNILDALCSLINEIARVQDEHNQPLENLLKREGIDLSLYQEKIFTRLEENPSDKILLDLLNLFTELNIYGSDALNNLTRFMSFTILDRAVVDLTEMQQVEETKSKKNFNNTKRRLEAVRTINPNHPSALIFLGRLHMLEGNRIEAIKVFSEQQKVFGLNDILTKELDDAEIQLEELD